MPARALTASPARRTKFVPIRADLHEAAGSGRAGTPKRSLRSLLGVNFIGNCTRGRTILNECSKGRLRGNVDTSVEEADAVCWVGSVNFSFQYARVRTLRRR